MKLMLTQNYVLAATTAQTKIAQVQLKIIPATPIPHINPFHCNIFPLVEIHSWLSKVIIPLACSLSVSNHPNADSTAEILRSHRHHLANAKESNKGRQTILQTLTILSW